MGLTQTLKDVFVYNTLKRKVFSFIMVVIICFLSAFLYTFYLTSMINDQINTMFSTSISLNEMTTVMDSFETSLENYLNTKSSDSFVQYRNAYVRLDSLKKTLDRGIVNDPSELQLSNIQLILTHYLKTSDEAIRYKRARQTGKYLESFAQITDDSSYIKSKVKGIENNEFKSNLSSYLHLTARTKGIRLNLFIIIILLILLSLSFVYSFSINVTQPIEELSSRADAISRGQYSIKKIYGYHFREAEVLKKAFSDMAEHINQYVGELQDKVETENKLRISETEKLKMKNALNEAELLALQSQINPHFLFNTLNAGMQLANIEGAERTASFLDYLSRLFRYNIQSMDNEVCLIDEMDNAKNYVALMKVRFADRLDIQFDIEGETEQTRMPPLILQPLIENALIHGFSNKLSVGKIWIEAQMRDESVWISIKDNGTGISPDILNQLNHYDFNHNYETLGHTTGLGLGNVYERLKHFYNRDDVLFFESEQQVYTRVIIKLPKGADHV